MPQSPFTPADTSRKRTRNVIESDSSAEEAEENAVQPTSNRRLFDNLLPAGGWEQLSRQTLLVEAITQSQWEVQEDDPAIDWRAQGEQLEEIEDSELDEEANHGQHTLAGSGHFTVPAEIQTRDNRSKGASMIIHESYRDFIAWLCQETGTTDAGERTLHGLPSVVGKDGNIELDTDWHTQGKIAVYSLALVVHVWQSVCFTVLTGDQSEETTSLSTQIASYFLAAFSLVELTLEVDIDEFKFAVEYWEARLVQKGCTRLWLQRHLLRGMVGPDLEAPCYRNDTASQYLRCLEEEGLLSFAMHILDKEQAMVEPGAPASPLKVLMQDKLESNNVHMALTAMLFSMGTDVIKAIIEGQIPRKSRLYNSGIYKALVRRSGETPGCYMNSICDAQGISPTPAQWDEVCETMLTYVGGGPESDEVAADIDQLIHPNPKWPQTLARRGLRRYTEERSYLKYKQFIPCRDRRQMVRFFVSELRKRLADEVARNGQHVPLSAPVVEVGIAKEPRKRLAEHQHHCNSNYLMNLAQSCFEFSFPGLFQLQQLVVFTCWRPEQSWLSEIFITRLAQGYVEMGGGFSHYPAGFSNGNAYQFCGMATWDKLEKRVLTPEFNKHFAEMLEEAKAKKARDDIVALQQYIDALANFYLQVARVEGLLGIGVGL